MRPLMPPVQTPDNLFHDGNPLTGELGTIVDADHLNNVQGSVRDVQAELISILTAANKQPDSTAGQLLAALKTIFVDGAPTALNTLNKIALAINYDPLFAANVNAALVLKAPLNSPQFTGVPAAPTPDSALNNNQIATTAFVQTLLSALISGAPANLNTLNKLAAAIGNDPNYSANVNASLVLKAPLANPGLTGIPTAPTAAAGTNTTQIATTAFVQAIITALIGGAPSSLNTLNKLSSAIGNDPIFSANVNAALVQKAPLASPSLTGTPTAPTAPAGDSSTQLSTTAFVAAALIALLPKRSFGLTDFIRIPDVPGGLILQWGTTQGADANGLAQATLPVAFPGNGLCAVCAYYNGSRNAISTQVASITPTVVQFFASGVSGAAAQGAPVRYFVVGY